MFTDLAILFGAVFTVVVSAGLGALLLREACEDWGARFLTGSALLSLAVFALCSVGMVYPVVFVVIGTPVLIAAWRSGLWQWRPRKALPGLDRRLRTALLLIVSVYFVLYFANAMAPEISYDGSRYHLGLVSRYLREHGFHTNTGNMYAMLSQGLEMVFLFAFAFGKHSAAAMVHFAFLLALGWLIFSYGRRAGMPLVGAAAALLVCVSPVVGVDGTSAYNDVAVGAIAFGLFYLLQIWDQERTPRLLVAIGLLAGFAYATKYTAWVAVPYALGFVAWKSRRWRDVLTVGVCAALLIAPWMLKNWITVGNPLAPFYNAVFHNPNVGVSFEREYREYLTNYDLKSRWEIPMQVTVRGALQGILGPIFLLSPIALLALRRREGRQLLLAAAIFGSTYFTNIGTRFLISPLPFVAVAMILVLSRVPSLAIAVVLVHCVLSWPSVVKKYAAANDWHLVKVPYREALRIKSEDGYLASNLVYYRVTRMVDRVAAPGSTVYTFRPIPEAYTSRNLLVAYQSEENIISQRIIFTGFVTEYAPVWRYRFTFSRQPLKAIRIVQTNTTPDIWTMHELHVFDGTREWVRGPQWQMSAHPDPWRLGNLLDDNLMTFWICEDTLHPGQFVEAEFPQAEQADSVRVETSPNQWGIRVRLEGQDATGAWHPLAAQPEYLPNAPTPPDLRRMASVELKRRGIDYVLIFDDEFGADDFQKNAALWGVRQVGEEQGARLYQLP